MYLFDQLKYFVFSCPSLQKTGVVSAYRVETRPCHLTLFMGWMSLACTSILDATGKPKSWWSFDGSLWTTASQNGQNVEMSWPMPPKPQRVFVGPVFCKLLLPLCIEKKQVQMQIHNRRIPPGKDRWLATPMGVGFSHGPLQIGTFWGSLAIYFHYCVQLLS